MKKILTKIYAVILAVAVIGLASCKKLSSYENSPAEGTPYQIMSDDATYANFKIAVDRANLQDMFSGNTEYTFFLPTTNAMIASGYTDAYLRGMPVAEASALVKNHIVAGKVDVTTGLTSVTALSGKPIPVEKQRNTFFAEGSDITRANIAARNSYINVINNTLTWHNTVLDAVTNFQHATADSKLDFTLAALARASTGSVNFNALLTGTEGYTLFAPTTAAWKAYGYGGVSNITAAPVETLVSILKNHVIKGTRLTTSFDSVGVPNVGGANIFFNRYLNFRTTEFYANGVYFGNGGANIAAKNGVMHVIPWILRAPLTTNTLDAIQANTNLSTFYAAVIRASTADTAYNFQKMLSGNRAYTVFAVTNAGMTAAGYPNVAAVDAAAPADLAKLVKLHILNRRVQWITGATALNGVNSLLLTPTGTNTFTGNPLTFSAWTIVANGAGHFSVKAAGNQSQFQVTGPNTVTTNGILNIVGGVFIP